MALAQGQEDPQQMQQQQNPESQFEPIQQQGQQNIPQLNQPNIEQLLNTLKTNPGALQLQGLQQQQAGLGNQQKQANPLQQKAQNPIRQQRNPIESNFAQDLSRGLRSKEEYKNGNKSSVKPKHYDALAKQKENLQDTIATVNDMLGSLDKGIKHGLWASGLAHFTPSWLDKNSEIFDKDSAHLINLQSQDIKGPASRFKLSLIEKEKPSLKHSPSVNRQILERYKKKAETNLANLDRQYPELSQVNSYENGSEQAKSLPPKAAKVIAKLNESEPASDYEEESELKAGGFTFIVQNGEWVYKG
jgi:hypothetical protein